MVLSEHCSNSRRPVDNSTEPEHYLRRSLWLRFVSDGTIEYSGFKAVYDFIPNPMEIIPFIPKCEFEIGGAMDFIGETNIIWTLENLLLSFPSRMLKYELISCCLLLFYTSGVPDLPEVHCHPIPMHFSIKYT